MKMKAGFTLIELMIVVAIIAIIAAIAIPNMLATRQSAWQIAAAAFCRTAQTTIETYRIKAGTYPLDDTAIAGGTGGAGTLFENSISPACTILTPAAANTYTFTFTQDVTMPTAKWILTATTSDASNTLMAFFIDESGVLRAELSITPGHKATLISPPYGG